MNSVSPANTTETTHQSVRYGGLAWLHELWQSFKNCWSTIQNKWMMCLGASLGLIGLLLLVFALVHTPDEEKTFYPNAFVGYWSGPPFIGISGIAILIAYKDKRLWIKLSIIPLLMGLTIAVCAVTLGALMVPSSVYYPRIVFASLSVIVCLALLIFSIHKHVGYQFSHEFSIATVAIGIIELLGGICCIALQAILPAESIVSSTFAGYISGASYIVIGVLNIYAGLRTSVRKASIQVALATITSFTAAPSLMFISSIAIADGEGNMVIESALLCIGTIEFVVVIVGAGLGCKNTCNKCITDGDSEDIDVLIIDEPTPADDDEDILDKYHELLEKIRNIRRNPFGEKEENWARVAFLLVTDGTACMQNMFVSEVKSKFGINVAECLKENKSNIKKNTKFKSKPAKSTPLFDEKQFNMMFPNDGGKTDETKFDISLLVKLFASLNVFEDVPCPERGGWVCTEEPQPHEDKLEHDLIRMRLMRNKMYAHIVKCELTNDQFNSNWEALEVVLLRLGATKASIDQRKTMAITTDERELCVTQLQDGFKHDILEGFTTEMIKDVIKNHKKHFVKGEENGDTAEIGTETVRLEIASDTEDSDDEEG